jgi:hypothetical protein
MEYASLQVRALQRATELKGGENALAIHLGVRVDELRRWQAGRALIPGAIFLKVADVITDHSVSQIGQGGTRP